MSPMVQFISGPLLLLSGIFLPLTLAPLWIQNVAKFNPIAYVINAMRALFYGNMSDPAVLRGVAVIVPLTLLALFWAARSYRRAVA